MWKAVRAQDDPPLGWYLPSFGAKVPATCLLGVGRLAGGASLKSELRLKGANSSSSI